MRKRIMMLVLLAAACWSLPAWAETPIGTSKTFGIGFGGGTLTSGLSGRFFLAPKASVEVIVGAHGGYGYAFDAAYLMDISDLVKHQAGNLVFGAGAGAGLWRYSWGGYNANNIAIFGVAELGWRFAAFPLELTAQWRPTFYIGDYDAGLYIAGSGGSIRWYF